MPANEATSARTKQAMISRVVPGDSADHSAFQAASCQSRTGEKRSGESYRRWYDQNPVHQCPPVPTNLCHSIKQEEKQHYSTVRVTVELRSPGLA